MLVSRHLPLAFAGLLLTLTPAKAADWWDQAFTPDRHSWLFSASYLAPTLYNRPMDMVTLEAARAWRFPSSFELQLRGGLMHTAGERSDDAPYGEGRDSTTTGVTSSLALRYELPVMDHMRLFAEGAMGFSWAQGQPFPAGGSAINGLLRGGGGIAWDLNSRYTLELVWHAAHVSNGGKPPHNPIWEGEGGGLALRYRL